MTTLDERLAEIREDLATTDKEWPVQALAWVGRYERDVTFLLAELERAEERIRALTNVSDAAERLVAIGEAWTPVDGITVDGEFNSCNVCGASFFEEDDHNTGCAYMDLVMAVRALAGEPSAPPVAQEET